MIGLVAFSKLSPVSISFTRNAVNAVAVLLMNFQRVSGTLFLLQSSDFIASPMKLHLDGFQRSAPSKAKA